MHEMVTWNEAIAALFANKGVQIRRKSWNPSLKAIENHLGVIVIFNSASNDPTTDHALVATRSNCLATDWEIISK